MYAPLLESRRPTRRRLLQLDALRVITCFSVVAVHVLSLTEVGQSEANNVAQVALHYSRFVFFVVSALVLVYTYLPRLDRTGRLPDPGRFRRHRTLIIGIPYAIWTLLYVTHAQWGHLASLPGVYLQALFTGDGKYHLYFLLVSLQFGLVFPAFVRLVAAARGRHLRILAISGVIQAITYAAYFYGALPAGWLSPLLGNSSLLAYQFWLLLGAVIAVNLELIHTWLTSHLRLVVLASLVSLAFAEAVYFLDQRTGFLPNDASASLQPATMAWATSAFGLLYLLANRLAALRSLFAIRSIRALSRLSFGIYLLHPAIIDLVTGHDLRLTRYLPPNWVTLVTVLGTVALTVPLIALIGRTPLSLPLIGRPRLRSAGVIPLFRYKSGILARRSRSFGVRAG